ncbi:MAG: hypothetical protein DRP42_03270 [Tenericutes bacterium]|nr:MAG: hypothetical protein DRP42_03270 [Mycoplasmatota bacterium]
MNQIWHARNGVKLAHQEVLSAGHGLEKSARITLSAENAEGGEHNGEAKKKQAKDLQEEVHC